MILLHIKRLSHHPHQALHTQKTKQKRNGKNYGKNLTKEAVSAALQAAHQRLTELDIEWDGTDRDAEKLAGDAQSLEAVLRPLAAELGLKTGELFGLLRVAVTGRTAAPPLFQTMAVLGRERCLKRIKEALSKLSVV